MDFAFSLVLLAQVGLSCDVVYLEPDGTRAHYRATKKDARIQTHDYNEVLESCRAKFHSDHGDKKIISLKVASV